MIISIDIHHCKVPSKSSHIVWIKADPHQPDTTHVGDYHHPPDVYILCIMSITCVSVRPARHQENKRDPNVVRQQCQQHQPFIDQAPVKIMAICIPKSNTIGHRPSAMPFEQPSKAQHARRQYPSVFGINPAHQYTSRGGALLEQKPSHLLISRVGTIGV